MGNIVLKEKNDRVPEVLATEVNLIRQTVWDTSQVNECVTYSVQYCNLSDIYDCFCMIRVL